MTDDNIDVTPRRKPVQARSRERVNSILKHAAEIFTEVGVDSTSMSAIARRSDMSLASLYRYFPNKAAIVKAIAETHVEKMEDVMRARLADTDIYEVIDVLVDFYYDFYRNEPGYAAIWSGVEAMPELRELDFQELYHNARDVDARLKQVFPHLSDTRRWNASLLLPRSTGSMLRLAVTLPETEATALVAEIKRMARAYLKELATP
ncbi:TetR/AcrR family transcriptional regulator [Marinobacter xestospongiae]|uniref:TetR/AcrR family transcriptional regulator n=1 Tax=Marinobacter xestospongiae TaxID=994319 RepID=A0ABU3VXT9_9GAMM|nr:TetR/AcrR family transcriptional regulator [Marinobacter xestospongiae]MDV2079102.1 TetR/AcrR family transcriptional regulator [Marinobacter xestospongiae]